MTQKKEKAPAKYYRLTEILKLKCDYNLIIGERSNGKTYAALEEALKRYQEKGAQFAYIRRNDMDLKGKNATSLFNGLTENERVKEITKGAYNSVYYYSGRFYFCNYDEQLAKRVLSPEPIGYTFSLNTSMHDKSTSFPNIKTIIFDEFLTRQYYLIDEFVIFMNLLSTIIRDRDDVQVFMLANTVNKYAPYFQEMGITNIKKMKPGSIDVYEYGDSGLRVAVEYTGGGKTRSTKPSDKYFAFNNPKLQMITTGVWELDIYPHLMTKYRPKDVRATFFIEYDRELLQGEIVKLNGVIFTYIHKKTTPLKDEEKDYIYSTRYNPRKNWHRCINKPIDKLGELIWRQFQEFRVFYQNNEIGDLTKNYIDWCVSQN